MAYVKPFSVKQQVYAEEIRNGLKAKGFTFGMDSRTRIDEYRSGKHRVRFIPCNSTGQASAAWGSNPAIDAAYKAYTAIKAEGGVLAGQKALLGGTYGGRVPVDLFVNPDDFHVTYSRSDPSGKKGGGMISKGSNTKGDSIKKSETDSKTFGNGNKASISGLRGRTATEWSAPEAKIIISGYCGNAPEIQIPRLKYIYGMFDPSIGDRATLAKQGNQRIASAINNEYPTDPSLYLWEMLYSVVNWPSGDKIPWKLLQQPQRYLGFCQDLTFTHEVGEDGRGTQTDIRWDMTFAVLQRRDYDHSGI